MPMEKAILALQMLVEGSSIRTASRYDPEAPGARCEKCEKLMGRLIVNIPVKVFNATSYGDRSRRRKRTRGRKKHTMTASAMRIALWPSSDTPN
jgi:hypothetical protein